MPRRGDTVEAVVTYVRSGAGATTDYSHAVQQQQIDGTAFATMDAQDWIRLGTSVEDAARLAQPMVPFRTHSNALTHLSCTESKREERERMRC